MQFQTIERVRVGRAKCPIEASIIDHRPLCEERSRFREKARIHKLSLDELLRNFRHLITNASAEGFKSRIQHLDAAARGYRNLHHYRTRIQFYCETASSSS